MYPFQMIHGEKECPRYELEFVHMNKLPEIQAMYRKHQDLFDYMREHSATEWVFRDAPYYAIKKAWHLYHYFLGLVRNFLWGQELCINLFKIKKLRNRNHFKRVFSNYSLESIIKLKYMVERWRYLSYWIFERYDYHSNGFDLYLSKLWFVINCQILCDC